jgi:hypothetical protein
MFLPGFVNVRLGVRMCTHEVTFGPSWVRLLINILCHFTFGEF